MMRYEEADESAVLLMDEIVETVYPWVKRAHIKMLFDLRKRKTNGKLCLAGITKVSEMLRFFTRRVAETFAGYDYVITIDRMAWRGMVHADRVRVIRHELRHIYIDEEKPDPYMLTPHDVNDFEIEIAANQDDPTWDKRVAAMALVAYKNQELGLNPYQGSIPDVSIVERGGRIQIRAETLTEVNPLAPPPDAKPKKRYHLRSPRPSTLDPHTGGA